MKDRRRAKNKVATYQGKYGIVNRARNLFSSMASSLLGSKISSEPVFKLGPHERVLTDAYNKEYYKDTMPQDWREIFRREAEEKRVPTEQIEAFLESHHGHPPLFKSIDKNKGNYIRVGRGYTKANRETRGTNRNKRGGSYTKKNKK
jgi:hypothetical protein